MDGYIKTAFYLYPKLEKMEKEYQQHIVNKAYLSYAPSVSAERLAEYIAEQIIEKELLLKLKGVLDGVWKRLSASDKGAIALKFFGKAWRKFLLLADKQAEAGQAEVGGACLTAEESRTAEWWERKKRSLRKKGQAAVEKARKIFERIGLTEERFVAEYCQVEWVRKIYRRFKALEKKKTALPEGAGSSEAALSEGADEKDYSSRS